MKKYIISDLHGNGNIYNSIMSYLENVNKEEEVTLYINGDLIDRGIDSKDMLLDVIKRIKTGPFKIEYLAGNHELLMYQFFLDKNNNTKKYYEDWFDNGGMSTYYDLIETVDEKTLSNVTNFISNLKIYHKFDEKINNKNIVLVHASSFINISDECNLKIKDNNESVYFALLSRENPSYFPFRCKIGNPNYFTIIGHTPVDNKYGFSYCEKENYLNIDGGSSKYVCGLFESNHIPLVEVNNNYLKILTFNNNNEITYGNYFIDNKIISLSNQELNNERKYLNSNVKIKKLIKNEDGVVMYKE